DGAVFVDLAAVPEPDLVAPQLAAAIGLGEGSGPPLERLGAALRDREMLIVLDNCEHVIGAAGEMAQRILATAEDVRVLSTSREVLGVPGEVDYLVPPLEAPAPDASLDELRGAEAVRLLLARIGREPDSLPETVLRTAAGICRDLDGLPLAIELA